MVYVLRGVFGNPWGTHAAKWVSGLRGTTREMLNLDMSLVYVWWPGLRVHPPFALKRASTSPASEAFHVLPSAVSYVCYIPSPSASNFFLASLLAFCLGVFPFPGFVNIRFTHRYLETGWRGWQETGRHRFTSVLKFSSQEFLHGLVYWGIRIYVREEEWWHE